MLLFQKLLGSKSLTSKRLYEFSIKNYMKTFEVENIQRSHGLFRVDENKAWINNKSELDKFLQQEKLNYNKIRTAWQKRTDDYYQLTSQRRDIRSTSIEQQFDNYGYFTKVKYIQDREYTTIHRRHLQSGKQQLVLDIMQYYSLKKYHKSIELLKTSFSESHRYIAFGFDLNNNEILRFMIKDIKENRIVGVKGWENNMLEDVSNVVWDKDRGIFYLKTENRRPCKLYYQTFDSEPELLYEVKDPACWMDIALSKDKAYLIISSSNKSHSHVKCLKLNQTAENFMFNKKNFNLNVSEFKNTQQIEQIHVNHSSDYMILWREKQLSNTISIKKDTQKLQTVIHKLGQDEKLTDMDIFSQHLVLYIQKNTLPIMRIINLNKQFTIEEPILPYSLGKIMPGSNQNYRTESLIVYFSTPFIYNQGYEYNFNTKTFKIVEKFQLTGPKFNSKKYEVKTVNVPSITGVEVPLTIIGQKRSKQYPKKLILKVYGFYGLPNEVSYDNMNYPLLEKGWTIAYAHVRGGGDKGKAWHLQALKNKSITWSDLQDCVAYLIKEKYTHPSILFLHSHSAGAITIWNAINKSPHLYKGVIMSYPFLDVLTSLMDKNDTLSSSDHAEFGNPIIDKTAYRSIECISPYENIEKKAYPLIYIVGGLNDYRCPVTQLVKFVKRFRQRSETNNRFKQINRKGIILKVQEGSSHLGSSDISEENYNNCQIYGFLDYLVEEASHDCKYDNQPK